MASSIKPRYAQIADALLAQIRAGQFAVGDLLPTEAELCAHYASSRHTVREALRVLGQLGMVERRQGSGTRVRARQPPVQYNKSVQTIEDLLQYGSATQLAIRRARQIKLNRELARLLDAGVGAAAVHLSGMRFTPGVDAPFNLSEVYLLVRRGLDLAALLDPETAPDAILDVVNVHKLSRVEQRFSAINLGPAEARRLGVEPGTAALRAQRRYFDVDGRVIAASISLHASERFAYSSVLTRARRE
jgi:DNA-binding GntR family transcriptional regulator